MSKNSVGDVYAKVIDDVCKASQTDFEEGGVELATLEMLRSEWQKKLSLLKVPNLPWDPKPEPATPSTVSNNVKQPSTTISSNGHAAGSPPTNPAPASQVKQENAAYPPTAKQPPVPAVQYSPPQFPAGRPVSAQERAALNLHQMYGNQAGAQIAALQGQAGPGRVSTPSSTLPQTGGQYVKKEEVDASLNGVDFKPDMSDMAIKASQTDGATDSYLTEMSRRRAALAHHRTENDRLIKSRVLASQQALEGGGLLLPLDQRHAPIHVLELEPVSSQAPSSSIIRAQGDAPGDDGEVDEDAINSDLDDPDDLDDPAEQEDSVQEVMLCTYDKVQRVKNKWKCTLKDGILRVDGAEYVFHKGQGEFEW